MSWQAYIDTSLVGSGQIDKAAIISVEGDSIWAKSSNLNLSQPELQNIAGLFKASDRALTEGFKVDGTKYLTIKADERSIYGKQGKAGAVLVKATKCILVAHHPDTVQLANCSNTVEQLADYLIKTGY